MAAIYKTLSGESIYVGDEGNYCWLHVTAQEKARICRAILDGQPSWCEEENEDSETADEFVARMGGVEYTEADYLACV